MRVANKGLIITLMKTEWTLITQGISRGAIKDDKTKKDDLIVLTFILQIFNRSLTWEPKGNSNQKNKKIKLTLYLHTQLHPRT